MQDDDRILQAFGRAAVRDRLMSTGMDQNRAECWCDAWQDQAAVLGIVRSTDYWLLGKDWIDRQLSEKKLRPVRAFILFLNLIPALILLVGRLVERADGLLADGLLFA